MRSWYDLTKEEKQNLKNEYSTKNNDNGKIIVLNILKVIFYLISFVMFFIVIILIISKIINVIWIIICNVIIYCYNFQCDCFKNKKAF